ncbi:M20 family metallopeptidase [Paenibacillus sp. SAFN-117]
MGQSKLRALSKYVSQAELEELLFNLIQLESHEEAPALERPLAEWIAAWCHKAGIEAFVMEAPAGRFNVIARVRGDGSGPSLMLNGHLDTVPPYDMEDAFRPRVADGRIYGRGSTDMKGALASMLAVLLAVQRSGVSLAGDVCFVATAGEETYSPGAYELLRSGFRCDYAIVGEPTGMQVGIAHKGVLWGEAEFAGVSVHGSVPDEGINAIYHASDWIQAIQETYIPSLKQKLHPLLGAPTVNIGMIEGGTRPVIVPNNCRIRFERRMIPGESEESVIGELQELLDGLSAESKNMRGNIRVSDNFHGVPHGPFETSFANPLISLLSQAYAEHFQTAAPEPVGLQFWTEAAMFEHIGGMGTVVCGPGFIAQAHSSNEYVSRSQLWAAYMMYAAAVYRLCVRKEEASPC